MIEMIKTINLPNPNLLGIRFSIPSTDIIRINSHSLLALNNFTMKSSVSIYKPYKQRSISTVNSNMFDSVQKLKQMNSSSSDTYQSFHFVGPSQVKQKVFFHINDSSILEPDINPHSKRETQKLNVSSKYEFNTTINRSTMLSSMQPEQQIEASKQTRGLARHRRYQSIWEGKKDRIRWKINNKTPALMDRNVRSLYIHPNQDKLDVINDFIVHYWEMSLRSNNPILERHIKGHRFDKIEKEKLLQLAKGTKKVQSSIPILPTEKLSLMHRRDLSVSGKNKIKKEAENETEKISSRYFSSSSRRISQEEVYKISYKGGKKWMGSQNL